jgi:hypothetical protein
MSAAVYLRRRGTGFQTRAASAKVVGRQGGGGGASNRIHRHGGCDDYCHHSERCRAGVSLLARLQPGRSSPTFLHRRYRGPLRLPYWRRSVRRDRDQPDRGRRHPGDRPTHLFHHPIAAPQSLVDRGFCAGRRGRGLSSRARSQRPRNGSRPVACLRSSALSWSDRQPGRASSPTRSRSPSVLPDPVCRKAEPATIVWVRSFRHPEVGRSGACWRPVAYGHRLISIGLVGAAARCRRPISTGKERGPVLGKRAERGLGLPGERLTISRRPSFRVEQSHSAELSSSTSVFDRGHLASSWLDLAGRRLRLDRLAATAAADFFPLPAAPAFLAHQTSRRLAILRCAPARSRVRRRSLPACRSPSKPRWSRVRNRDQRSITMANIGSFKKVNAEFQGEIVTLSVQARNVRIVPESSRTNDNAPSHRSSSAAPRSGPPGPSAPTRAATTSRSSSTIRASTPPSTPTCSMPRTARPTT